MAKNSLCDANVFEYNVESIKRAVSLLSVIEEHAEGTRRAGDHHVCPCPFHNEKTPSFHIYSDHYHCYGCGEHGDVVSFVQKIRGLSFRESLQYLSGETSTARPSPPAPAKVTVDVPVLSPGEREGILEALRLAQTFYLQELSRCSGAQAYLERDREVSSLACATYGIGYAPPGFGLSRFLKERGVSEETAQKAGLLARSSRTGKSYPQLQERITFPIYDLIGEVVGFGGRSLPGEREEGRLPIAKYLNTPQTPLFDKSSLLFGLRQASDAIEEKGFAILCEGYFDVASLTSVGVTNAVASCGTAFTSSHAGLLLGKAERVLVLFDADGAGRKGIAKMFDVFGESAHRVSVGVLPEGHDPSSFVKCHGKKAREELSRLPLQSLLMSYLEGLDEISDKERVKIRAVVSHCSDPERRKRLQGEIEPYLVPAERKAEMRTGQGRQRYMGARERVQGVLRGIESRGDRRYAVLSKGEETILIPLATRNIESVPVGSTLQLRGCEDGSVKCTVVMLGSERMMKRDQEVDQSLGG